MKNNPIKEGKSPEYNKKAIRMIGILIVLGIITGLLLSFVFINEANQRIEDFENRMKYTYNVLNDYLIYPRNIYHLQQVKMNDINNNPVMCLVIVIKQSFSPVEVKGSNIHDKIPIRVGPGLEWKNKDIIFYQKRNVLKDNYNFLLDFLSFLRDKD